MVEETTLDEMIRKIIREVIINPLVAELLVNQKVPGKRICPCCGNENSIFGSSILGPSIICISCSLAYQRPGSQKNSPGVGNDTIASVELAPCPFCGSSNVSLETETPESMHGSHVSHAFVECNKCYARGPRADDWRNAVFKEDAVISWNARL